MKTYKNRQKAISLMALSALSFAVMGAAAKACSGLSAAQIVFTRSVLSLLVIGFFMPRGRAGWIGRGPRFLLARGVVGFTALFLYFSSLSQIDLGTGIVLNYTAPIFAVLIARIFYKEESSPVVSISLALSFLGIFLVSAPEFGVNTAALLAALLSGFLAGIVHVLIRYGHAEESPWTIIFYFLWISAIGSFLIGCAQGFQMPTAREAWLLLLITVSSFLGQAALTFSLRRARVAVVSPFGYLAPVYGLVFGWIFWNEPVGFPKLAGSALIVGCGVWMFRARRVSDGPEK